MMLIPVATSDLWNIPYIQWVNVFRQSVNIKGYNKDGLRKNPADAK